MKHVLGIGGIFFKASDPEKLGEWYQKHLGLEVEEYGGVTFRQAAPDTQPQRQAYTVWSPFAADTDLRSERQAFYDQLSRGGP